MDKWLSFHNNTLKKKLKKIEKTSNLWQIYDSGADGRNNAEEFVCWHREHSSFIFWKLKHSFLAAVDDWKIESREMLWEVNY